MPSNAASRRAVRCAGLCAALALLVPAPSLAQWLDYPTPGLPRTADGAPDLSAPTPRTADGKPDLSGVWSAANLMGENDVPEALAPFLPPEAAAAMSQGGQLLDTCPVEQCIGQGLEPGAGPPVDMVNIGQSLPGGLLPYQPWARERVLAQVARQSADDPHAHCLPSHFPRAWTLPQFVKIVQTPGLTVLLDEFNAGYRQVFTDGRPLPVDPSPTWNGYSIGHWDGDALVIETIGFRDDLWLDMVSSPLTEAARVTERLTRPDTGRLEVELTVDDPKAYTAPWTVKIAMRLMPDTDLLDEICLENEQDTRLMERP